MMRVSVMLILLAAFGLSPAYAAKRVALVIGNSAYEHVTPLANPRNDAEDMTAKLESLGFEVVSGLDLDFPEMRRTVRKFANSLNGADMALFFYAGHGLQVNGQNYMAPIDARLSNEIDLEFEAIPVDLIMAAMERSTEVNLVFLDACRDNPLARNLARSMGTRSGSVGRGLAKLGSGIGSLISFATQPGNVALDGKGRNSPFTTALLEHLGTPGQDITRDLIYVRRAVLEQTDGKQVPWDNSSLTGEVILKAKPTPAVEARPADNSQFEITFWNSIKDSDSRAYYETYLSQFPEGSFAALARLKISDLDAKKASVNASTERAKQDADLATKLREAELEKIRQHRAAEDKRRVEELERAETARNELFKQKLAELEAVRKKAEDEAGRLAELEEKKAGELALAALQPQEPDETTVSVAVDPREDRELVRSLQRELNRVGCSAGAPDGLWGRNTDTAIRNFSKHTKREIKPPSQELLDAIRQEQARICPLVCGRNQEMQGGRCVDRVREASTPDTTNIRKKSTSTTTTPQAKTTSRHPDRDCYYCPTRNSGKHVCVKKGVHVSTTFAVPSKSASCRKL